MAAPEQEVPPLPTCILPIFGIPGSGKTLLTRHLVSADVALQWNLVAVHFDDFYPPDLRSHKEPLSQDQGEEATAEPFIQKSARQEVNACLEHLTTLNNLGGTSCSNEIAAVPAAKVPPQWEKFVSCICNVCNRKEFLDKKGRIHHNCRRPTVLLLDDNMALRSMRYEYYQLARKYHLSFAEVCVKCPTSVAVERNSKRMIPIPHSTIERMEQRLELPDPVNHHWEQRSIVISSESDQEQYLKNACEAILPLVEDAFAHPVPPLPERNSELQESCRIANLESYIHQADNVLRKCVSAILKEYSGSKPKVFIAQQANSVRKQLLEELRAGRLVNNPLDTSVGSASAEFRHLLEDTFTREIQNFI